MKARGRGPQAECSPDIVSRCLEPGMKHEARVFDMIRLLKQKALIIIVVDHCFPVLNLHLPMKRKLRIVE